MILDWLVYGLIIWALAIILNKTAFRDKPAPRSIAWVLTIILFFVNVVALSILKFLRYQLISENLGAKITPNAPLDMGGAFVFAYLFFTLLNKKAKAKEAIAAPTVPINKKEISTGGILNKQSDDDQTNPIIKKPFENRFLEEGCSQEAIDYLKNPIHIYSYMQKYKKTEAKILEAIKKGKLRGCYVNEALWVENKKF